MLICIAGKNDIAVDVLEYLIEHKQEEYELGVVCNRTENGENSWQKSLRFCAIKNNITEYKLEELYNKKKLLFLSLEYDSIVVPEKFVDARLYNIHFSLLPSYKGMYTSPLPILNDEDTVGVTLHEIDRGIDTGDIIAQKRFKLEKKWNCRDLYCQYIKQGTYLVLDNLQNLIENKYRAEKQATEGASYYSKKAIDYSKLEIDLRKTADEVDRQIRAYNFREYQLPEVYGKRIIATRVTNIKSKNKPGSIIMQNNQGMMVATIDYNIILYFDRFEELLTACKNGDMNLVQDILLVKEHLECKNIKGWTPLIVATYNNRKDIVQYLILQGADIFVKNNNGTNLLMYAKDTFLNYKDITLFKLFLELGLDKEEKDFYGKNLEDYLTEGNKDELEDVISCLEA